MFTLKHPHVFRTLRLAGVLVCLVSVAVAQSETRSLDEINPLLARLTEASADTSVLVGQIRAAAGLPPLAETAALETRAVTPVSEPPGLEEIDLQLALIQLAFGAGTNDHLALLQAQTDTDDPKALVLRSGAMTLAELGEAAVAQGLTGISRTDDGWMLTRPLVVWQDASLTLTKGDQLQMSAADGAFLLAFGNLALNGADMEGDATKNPRAPDFRPFVLVSGAGTLVIDQSRLAALGFGQGTSFGGLVVANSGLFQPEFAPLIQSSSFDQVQVLKFEGGTGLDLRNSTIASGNLILVGSKSADVSGNRFTDAPSIAAIFVSQASRDIHLASNLVVRPEGMGMLVDGLSQRVDISDNLIADSGGVGLNLRRSTCLLVQGNLVTGSDSSAVRLTAAGPAFVTGNALLENRRAGIDLIDQRAGVSLIVDGNWFAGNEVGLRGGGIGSVRLSANDLSGQLPRQFGGEFAPHLAGYLASAETTADDYLITDLRPGANPTRPDDLPIRQGENLTWPASCEEK